MQLRSNHKMINTVTRLLCVIALLFVGFAHRVPAVSPQPNVDLSVYALPDGTLPVICHTRSGTGDGGGTTVFFSDCEFCRLADAAILPVRHHVWAPPGARADAPSRADQDLTVFPVHYAGTPARGPPPA